MSARIKFPREDICPGAELRCGRVIKFARNVRRSPIFLTFIPYFTNGAVLIKNISLIWRKSRRLLSFGAEELNYSAITPEMERSGFELLRNYAGYDTPRN